MKITRVPTSPDLQILQKVRSENNICPFCGESRKSYSIDNGISGGDIVHKKLVSAETNQPWYKCMFSGQKAKVMWYLKFTCRSCGAKWESDEYPMPDYEVKKSK